MQREHTKGPRPKSLAERFWPKVDTSGGPDACWTWTAALNTAGYGVISAGPGGASPLRAHRVAWELTHGPIPSWLDVLHACDNPPCVNPAHLWLGTASDNGRDMASKGRARGQRSWDHMPRGEDHGYATLTEADVREIRRAYAAREATQTDLGRRFGVHQTLISLIVLGKAWRHVK